MKKLIWKIIILVINACVSCTLLWASPSTQNKRVTLNCRNHPLRLVLEDISKQTDAKFVYEDKLVDGKTVSCRFENMPFDDALKYITEQSDISFRFQSDKRVVLYKKNSNFMGKGIIEGRVIDAASRAYLRGANVFLAGTTLGSSTNENGEFIIYGIPDGSYDLNCMFIGYAREAIPNIQVSNSTRSHFDIEMNMQPLRLRELVVMPSRFAIMGSTPTISQTLTRRDIETLPQLGDDIYRAVKRLPGLTSNEFSSRFTVRGGEHDQILTLIDGLQVYEPFHLKDIFGGALSIIDAAAIESIDLMTGAFSAAYGDRMSGVFKITSKSPERDEQRYSIGFSLMNARVFSEGSFNNNKGSWLFSGRRGYLNNLLKITGPSEYQPGNVYYDFLGKFENQLNEKNRLAFHILHADDRIDFYKEGVNTRYGSTYGWLTLNSILNPKMFVRTIISTGRIGHNREAMQAQTVDDYDDFMVTDKREFSFYGFKQDWNLEVDPSTYITWGMDVQMLSAEYEYNSIIQDGQNYSSDDPSNKTKISLRPSGHKLGIYLSNRYRIVSPLTAEVGLRYDYTSYTNDRLLNPRINLVYALGPKTCIRGGWGHFHQTQGIHELHVQDDETRFVPAAARAEHAIIGLEHEFMPGIRLRIEGYYKQLSHLRPIYQNWQRYNEIFPEMSSDRLKIFMNGSTARGIEIYIKKVSSGKFSWWASYALSEVSDHVTDIINHTWIRHYDRVFPGAYDQRHTVYFDFNYRPTHNWQFNIAWEYHTGCPYTELVLVGNEYKRASMGEYHGSRYPAYHRMDVRINRHFNTPRGRVTAFLEIMNLYNRKNVAYYDYLIHTPSDDRPPNMISKLPVHWFPLLPSIGVSWSWNN